MNQQTIICHVRALRQVITHQNAIKKQSNRLLRSASSAFLSLSILLFQKPYFKLNLLFIFFFVYFFSVNCGKFLNSRVRHGWLHYRCYNFRRYIVEIFHWRKLGIFIFNNHPKRDHKLLSYIQHNLSNWSLNLTICLKWKRFINSSFTNSLYKALIVDFSNKIWYSKQKKLRKLNVLASFGFGLAHCKLKDHVTFLFSVTCFDLLCHALWFLILPLS